MQIEDRLQMLMQNVFDNEKVVVLRDLTANDVDEWDSLAHIHLIVAIEREFKIKISASEVLRLKNVGDILDMIYEKVEKISSSVS